MGPSSDEGVHVTKKLSILIAMASLLVVAALLMAACGDDSSGGSASGGGGSDADYVAATCKAQAAFVTAVSAIEADDAPGRAKADTAIGNLSAAMTKMNPPADAKAYHDQIVKFLDNARKTVKDQGLTAIGNESPGDPPAAVATRLDAIAANNKDCTDAHFKFSNK